MPLVVLSSVRATKNKAKKDYRRSKNDDKIFKFGVCVCLLRDEDLALAMGSRNRTRGPNQNVPVVWICFDGKLVDKKIIKYFPSAIN